MRLHEDSEDCLVLDFVDLSALDIITTATLDAGKVREPPEREEEAKPKQGMPPLPEEDDRDEAPATLEEIAQRLVAFDPLTMAQSEEAAAISVNAWLSLGARGMMLHFLSRRGEMLCFELRPAQRSGVEVWLGDRKLTRCSTMQEAVCAVDSELPNYGQVESAQPDAPWRQHPITPPLQRSLDALTPPRIAHTVGDAIAHIALSIGLE